MNDNRAGYRSALIATGLAFSLALTGCGPAGNPDLSAATTSAPDVSSSAEPAPAATATPSGTPSAEASSPVASPSPTAPAPAAPAPAAPVPVAPAAPAPAPAAPALKTYRFPDGLSFTYPGGWTVRTVVTSAGIATTVHDSAGEALVDIRNNYVEGCASAPTRRVLLDQAPVPGLAAAGGDEAPRFGFAETGGDFYSMGVSHPRYLEEGDGVISTCQLVRTGTGWFSSAVLFNVPAFPNRAAAQAWMATQQYSQLKALLTSLRYS